MKIHSIIIHLPIISYEKFFIYIFFLKNEQEKKIINIKKIFKQQIMLKQSINLDSQDDGIEQKYLFYEKLQTKTSHVKERDVKRIKNI